MDNVRQYAREAVDQELLSRATIAITCLAIGLFGGFLLFILLDFYLRG